MFAIVKRYYNKGIYSKEDVNVFIRAGRLTEIQYKEITGENYVA